MEEISDIVEILGRRVFKSFIGLRCDNRKGAAKVSYEDIIQIEDSFPENVCIFVVFLYMVVVYFCIDFTVLIVL